MAMCKFFCPYCRRWLPVYFVPDGHARVPVICFECHIEQQDIYPRKDSHTKNHDRLQELLSEKMYAAWKLVYVDGLSHEAAAGELGISQQSLSGRLSRVFSWSSKRAVKQSIRLRGNGIRAIEQLKIENRKDCRVGSTN